MPVPLLDLNAQYAPIEDAVLAAIAEVFRSKQFIGGPKITELEQAIASYCEAKHAIAVSSGTDALILSLMAMGIGEGDEVITTPFTFFATAGSIHRVGATPVFVDIHPDTFNIDTNQIEAAITDKTKAIMPVHLFGQIADMDVISDIAKAHNLLIIEDAAQAIGATYQSREGLKKAGSMGDAAAFSFFPSKNLGACGDGGIITTNDDDLAQKMISLRNHGAQRQYFHEDVGGNFRCDAIQAAVLLVKLPLLNSQHEGRRQNAASYNQAFADAAISCPIIHEKSQSIYNQYTIRSEKRDEIKAELDSKKIGNAIYYPLPLHMQQCFAYLGHSEGDFPNAEKASREVLSIPVYSELNQSQVQEVIAAVLEAVG